MKYNKYKYLVAALCAANAAMAMAQETVASDTLPEQSKVQLAFRTVEANETLVGVEALDYKEVIAKDYLTYPLNDLLAFVAGGANTYGGSYLILIDGIPRPIDNLKPDEIETVSFLKGANAVALYGSHAAKGVILIKTKRGTANDIAINLRANTGWNVAKSYPKYLGSAEYMSLYNEARKRDGLPALYSDEEIYHYASGENPYRYPDVDFYSSDYIKKAYNRTDVTAEIDGGNDRAQYYTNISFYNIGSEFKVGEAKKSYTNRFSVRGNVDIKISDYIKSYVDANITFYNSRGYTTNSTSFYGAAATWRPNRIAPFIPVEYVDPNATDALNQLAATNNILNGKFIAGSITDPTNVFADLYVGGSAKHTYRKLQFETGLDVDLSQLTEGLSFHTQFGMDYASDYTESYHDKYKSFHPIWSNYNGKDVIVRFEETGTKDEHTGNLNLSKGDSDMTLAFDANFNYDRVVDDHSFGAVAVLRGFQYRYTGEYHSESDASVGLNLHYDFAKKYFVDATGSVVHTAKLAKENRNGFSPAITVGWNLAKESFLEDGIFNNLTLSVGAANLATDTNIDGYNSYIGSYSETGAWWAWTDQSQQSTVSKRGWNKGLEMVRNKEVSVGVNAAMLDNMLTFKVTAYRNSEKGLVIGAGSQLPEYMLSYYPESSFIHNINYNANLRKGIEFQLGFNKKFGDVEFSALLNGIVNTNEATKRDDTAYEYDYQKRQGKYIDGFWGYECLGFISKEDADAANGAVKKEGVADQSYFGQKLAAGDLKYKDQNGDGKIDEKDAVELGRYGSSLEAGLGLTAKYRGFVLFVSSTGVAGGLSSKNASYFRPVGEDKYSINARDRWTEETAETAKAPRLTTSNGANNTVNSDFWTFKNNAFYLDKVQLTYNFPTTMFEGNKLLHDAQVYVSGSNLLTAAKEKDWLELNVGGSAQTRFYNLGVKVTF